MTPRDSTATSETTQHHAPSPNNTASGVTSIAIVKKDYWSLAAKNLEEEEQALSEAFVAMQKAGASGGNGGY
jgi:hypothetical protein